MRPRDLAEIDAKLEAYWGDPERLSRVLGRRYETEREVRTGLKGEEPALWVLLELRSGEWHRRVRRNVRNFNRNKAKLTRWKREGYSFDSEHRLVAPVSRPCAPRRAATTSRARPRARRATARAAASRGSPDDDDEPGGAGPPRLRVVPPAERAFGGAA